MEITRPSLLDLGIQALQEESERQYGEVLEQEQVDCYLDPARFAEAHAMLDDMEARLRFDVDIPRRALGSKIATLRATFPDLYVMNTGGGCEGFALDLSNGGYLLLTHPEDPSLPVDSEAQVAVGVYTADGDPVEDPAPELISLDALPVWINANRERAP